MQTCETAPVHPLMTALGQGLPVALLVDLTDPAGPRAAEMFEREAARTAPAVAARTA